MEGGNARRAVIERLRIKANCFNRRDVLSDIIEMNNTANHLVYPQSNRTISLQLSKSFAYCMDYFSKIQYIFFRITQILQ